MISTKPRRLVFACLFVLTGWAQSPVIGTLEGGPAELHGEVAVLAGRPRIASGTQIDLANASARLLLERGGYMRLCGPFRATFLAGGGDALLLTLQTGAMELRYPALASDSIITPDFRLTAVVSPAERQETRSEAERQATPSEAARQATPRQPAAFAPLSANIALEPSGALCIANRGSTLHVNDVFAGSDYEIEAGRTWLFEPSKVPVPAAACGCEPVMTPQPPAPAGRAAVQSTQPQAQRSGAPSMVLSYPPELPPPPVAQPAPTTRQRAAAPAHAAVAPGQPARQHTTAPPRPAIPAGTTRKRGNIFARFFRHLFGGKK